MKDELDVLRHTSDKAVCIALDLNFFSNYTANI